VGLFINCASSTVTNVVARNNGQQGFYANSNNMSFLNCTSTNNTADGFDFNSAPLFISVVGCTSSYNGGNGIINTVEHFTVNDSVIVGNSGAGISLVFVGTPVVIHNTIMKDNHGAGLDSGGTTSVFDSCICNNSVTNVRCSGFDGSVNLAVQNTAATGIDTACVPLSGTFIACTTAADTAICQYPSWYPRTLPPPCSVPSKTTTGNTPAATTGKAPAATTASTTGQTGGTTGSSNSGNTYAATTAASNQTGPQISTTAILSASVSGHSDSSFNDGTKIDFPRAMLMILISLAGLANFE